MNLYSTLADSIRRHADQPAVSCGEHKLTYAQFDRAAAGLAAFFEEEGYGPGDRVLLFLRNGFEYPTLLLGVMRAGLVVVPVNAKLHAREVAYICRDAAPRIVFVHREQQASLREALGDVEMRIVVLEDFAFPVSRAAAISPAEVSPQDPAWIFYTSGTTGSRRAPLSRIGIWLPRR